MVCFSTVTKLGEGVFLFLMYSIDFPNNTSGSKVGGSLHHFVVVRGGLSILDKFVNLYKIQILRGWDGFLYFQFQWMRCQWCLPRCVWRLCFSTPVSFCFVAALSSISASIWLRLSFIRLHTSALGPLSMREEGLLWRVTETGHGRENVLRDAKTQHKQLSAHQGIAPYAAAHQNRSSSHEIRA